jgi:hypothetical protein
MSYDLIYDRQFVKGKNDEYIPFVLGGCSNLFEAGYGRRDGRRVRSWQVIGASSEPFRTEAEMVEAAEAYRQSLIDREDRDDKYDDKSFGWFTGLAINGTTRSTTYGRYKGLFVTGCKKALTIEQLAEANEFVTVGTPSYGFSNTGLEPLCIRATSTDHLYEAYELVKEHLQGTDFNPEFRISLDTYSGAKWLRKKFFPKKKKEKELVTLDEYFVIEAYSNQVLLGEFVKFTRNGAFQYTGWTGKTFKSEAEANRKLKAVRAKRSDIEFKVKKCEGPIQVWVTVNN